MSSHANRSLMRTSLLSWSVHSVSPDASAATADPQFLEDGLFPEFQPGDKVAIESDRTNQLVSTLLMYGNIVTNRWRTRKGLEPITAPDDVPLKDIYDSLYTKPPGT